MAGEFKFCAECGAKLAADVRFCTNCGAKCAPLEGAAPAAPAEPPGQDAFVKGQQYFLGDGQEQNLEAAQKEFSAAAKAGHKEAPIWVQICLHYREIMQLSQQADAVHNGKTPEEAAKAFPSVMKETAPPNTKRLTEKTAAPAAATGGADKPRQDEREQRPQGQQRIDDRNGGRDHDHDQSGSSKFHNLGKFGKIAAGAAVGAVAMSMFRGGHSNASGPDFPSTSHFGMGQDGDTDSQYASDDTNLDDTGTYDDSGATDDTASNYDDADQVDTDQNYDDTDKTGDDADQNYDDTDSGDDSYDDRDSSDDDSDSDGDDYDDGDSSDNDDGDWDSSDDGDSSDDW